MSARCVCGRSERFPVCDGSHGEGWECGNLAPSVSVCVVAGPHLASLGERLAHREGGVAAHRIEGPVRAERLIVLTDAMDLDLVESMVGRVQSPDRRVIVVDAPAACVADRFADWPVHSAAPDDPLHLWRAVLEALDATPAPIGALPRVFLSHAVADEPVLQPVVDYLRRWAGADVFLCADSIAPGDPWRERIEAELRASDVFVLAGSRASFASTYCAFEVGQAMALGKACRMVVLDGAVPPPFIGHLQATDVIRHRNRRPWLSEAEALTDVLLGTLGPLAD